MVIKRTYLKRIGKRGRLNLIANKKLAQMWNDMGIDYCELAMDKYCSGQSFLGNAHRHKRWQYIKHPEKLYDYKQVIRICTACHQLIENDKELTETVFKVLRGPE